MLSLVFNEGYLAADGAVAARRELAADAEWLTSLLVRLMPDESEPLGLLALMRLHLARLDAAVPEGARRRLGEGLDRLLALAVGREGKERGERPGTLRPVDVNREADPVAHRHEQVAIGHHLAHRVTGAQFFAKLAKRPVRHPGHGRGKQVVCQNVGADVHGKVGLGRGENRAMIVTA